MQAFLCNMVLFSHTHTHTHKHTHTHTHNHIDSHIQNTFERPLQQLQLAILLCFLHFIFTAQTCVNCRRACQYQLQSALGLCAMVQAA